MLQRQHVDATANARWNYSDSTPKLLRLQAEATATTSWRYSDSTPKKKQQHADETATARRRYSDRKLTLQRQHTDATATSRRPLVYTTNPPILSSLQCHFWLCRLTYLCCRPNLDRTDPLLYTVYTLLTGPTPTLVWTDPIINTADPYLIVQTHSRLYRLQTPLSTLNTHPRPYRTTHIHFRLTLDYRTTFLLCRPT